MKRAREEKWTVILLVAGIVLLGAVSAWANDLYVGTGGTYSTIQAAIDAASDGDTIHVAAGMYTPTSTIVVTKNNLIIDGPQANVDPRLSYGSTRVPGPVSEAVIDGNANNLGRIILIDADNVVINGLEVKSGTQDMIRQSNPHTGTVVKYCMIHDGRGDEGVQLKKATKAVLEYNYVFDIADKGDGLNIADGSSQGIIRYNEVASIHGENAAIYIYDAEHMQIIGNLVRDSGAGGNDGIKIGNKGGDDATKTDVLVKDNIIHDITQDGISVYMSGVTVEGNDVYNCYSENGAIYLAFGISNIDIHNNIIHDNRLKPQVKPHVGGIGIEKHVNASNVHIYRNSIYNNTPYDVNNNTSVLLDASGNWWGTTDPAIVASLVDPNKVDFTPMLNSGADGDPATPGWQPDLSSVTVHSLGQQVGTPGRIQEGINLVSSGGAVNVAAGTYNELATISYPLMFLGANAGIHPAVGTSTTEVVGTRGPETVLSHNHYAIQPAADNITVDGYKFTGAGGRIIDTYDDANNFHLTNCIFNDPSQAVTKGVIQFGGGSHTDMLIDYNLFQDQGDHTLYFGGGPYDRLRIAYNKFNGLGDGIFWTATPLVDGIVEDNEFDGTINGIPGQGGTGMNIGQGGNIIIRNNWFHDMSYTGFQVGIVGGDVTGNTFEGMISPWAGYPSSSFMLWGGQWGTTVSTNVVIDKNVVKFNGPDPETEHGIRILPGIDATTIHVNYNKFVDRGSNITALAIRNQGTGNVDATLNWWGDANGPTHVTNTNTTTGARVDDNVVYSPWLGTDPDSDPTTVGVQITGPMTIIVAPIGPKPTTGNGNTGYLDEGIQGSNDLPYTDTIEVKHGTYDATEPITDAVNIVSEPGSAAHTTLNGNMSINENGVLVGLPLQGFRINGNVTVGAGADAGTSGIHWCDLYGNVTNSGTGTFNAQYNYWGTQLASVIDGRTTGLVDYDPFLPRNADDSYTDIQALMAAGVAGGIDPAIDQLWLMVQLGQDVNTFIGYSGVAGAGAFAGAPAGATINLGGAAGGGGAVEGTISSTYAIGDLIDGHFTITDPVTGEPVTDAAVTLSLLGPDGSNGLAFWGCATYDETTGEYVFSIDTSGLSPGTYELIIQTDAGQSKTVSIEVQAA